MHGRDSCTESEMTDVVILHAPPFPGHTFERAVTVP